MKANFLKLTLAVTSICFRHLRAMQIKPMNIQTGLSLEAQVLKLAYSWWRESCGPEGQVEKKEIKLCAAALYLPGLPLSVQAGVRRLRPQLSECSFTRSLFSVCICAVFTCFL